MTTRLMDLKKALSLLGNLDQELASQIEQISTPELVALGQRLWWIIKRSNKALEIIKEQLRLEAGGASRRFESGEGAHCLVTYSAQKVVLRKDIDLFRLKAALGNKFLDFFEESVSYRPRKDFQELTKDCSPEEMQILLTAVDLVSDPPRISFKD